MPYGAYLRKSRRKFRKIAVQANTPVRATYRYGNKKAMAKRGPRATFAQRVNQIISRNNENKFTSTLTSQDGVVRVSRAASVDTYKFYTWVPAADATGSRLFNLPSGTGEGGRIGNTIKLKRWVIKGIIQPSVSAVDTLPNSFVGYVDVYFGKLLKDITAVANTLDKLYQNGGSATTPTCLSTDMLNPLNKDRYKVYYHRRFKMGAASDPDTYSGTAATAQQHPASNDFKLSQTFGFDVCKYILKNKHLKFDDADNVSPYQPPNNSDVLNLTLWATFTPQTGQAAGTGTTGTYRSLYSIDALSYAEYEDA